MTMAMGAQTLADRFGLRPVVVPDDALCPAEREWLSHTFPAGAFADAEPYRLRIVEDPPWSPPPAASLPDHAPARLEVADRRIRILHHRYLAEVDPFACEGWLFRRRGDDGGLGVTLQTALGSRLPLTGGLPLHAAGVVLRDAGVAFFGPSGAGKSTLAATSPGEILSDELVVAQGAPFRLHASGFWGTLGRVGRSDRVVPLAAVIELGKGPVFSIEPLDRVAALRRLMGVVLVPLLPALWSAALAVLGRLVKEVPAYRLRWRPDSPPWHEIERLLVAPAVARRQ